MSLLSLDCEYLQIFGERVIVAIVTKAVIGICHVSSVLSTVRILAFKNFHCQIGLKSNFEINFSFILSVRPQGIGNYVKYVYLLGSKQVGDTADLVDNECTQIT